MLNYKNLEARVRQFMVDELDADIRGQKIVLSPRLNRHGAAKFVGLLRDAALSHNDAWLADQLNRGLLNEYEYRTTKKGTVSVHVPITAAETLADGEFNRLYARAICLAAISDGKPTVTLYRASGSHVPREISEELVGTSVSAEALLDDLRTSQGVETALHIPPGPNSGLSVKL